MWPDLRRLKGLHAFGSKADMANLSLRVGALGKDEARGIAGNAVKLPELLRSQTDSGTAQEHALPNWRARATRQ
jgi:hypothetical protein